MFNKLDVLYECMDIREMDQNIYNLHLNLCMCMEIPWEFIYRTKSYN